MNYIPYEQQDFLMHHGILGQKWGIRRYQNPDGSLTDAGRKRYLTDSGKLNERGERDLIDNLDGTYFDTRKAQRILGPIGKPIDFYRAANHDIKAAEKREAEHEKKLYEEEQRKKESAKVNNEVFSKQMDESGWTSETVEFGNGRSFVYSKSDRKFGDKDVVISASFDSYNKEIDPKQFASSASKTRDKYVKEYKKVLSTTTETIAKDMYDSGEFSDWHGEDPKYNAWTRQEFKKNLQNMVQSVEIGTGYQLVNFYGDGNYKDLFGGHMLTTEYDIYKDKTYHGTQMNG